MWRVHRTIGMGGDKLVGEVAGDEVERTLGDAVRDRWAEEYAALVDEVAPLPGAGDLVRRLVAAGHLVALASSGEKQFSDVAVRVLGIADDVHTVTSSGDAEDSKPDPDILGVTLDKVPASKAVLVGDTPYDVEAAARIGLACIGVLTGGFSRAELESAGAALVVEDLTELLDLDWSTHLREPTL
jgi:HAD superfamily hydrolase (TIGR01549 family)